MPYNITNVTYCARLQFAVNIRGISRSFGFDELFTPHDVRMGLLLVQEESAVWEEEMQCKCIGFLCVSRY